MEFRVLQYFLAVTREGNISAAAQSLNLSQPSLSRQLRDLEEELGVTLFIRGKRRIELTEEGLILRKRASEMMQLVELTESEISEIKNNISGSLNIGAGESYSMHLITRVFYHLKTEYPNIRLNIFSGDTEALKDKLDRGLLDFALIFTDFDRESYHHLTLDDKEIFGVISIIFLNRISNTKPLNLSQMSLDKRFRYYLFNCSIGFSSTLLSAIFSISRSLM